ncbi:hypothetical protein DPMN_167005 [Dreissena polymorpha]|uniref:Uncharacterized protein n=1 Tax=Dreissena polymorpha TaxID=45954 RepID=A0A9D4EZL4_DREPO|nr:hypothetical protein DPMN_167005 [Dreissena polymorpha]
MYHWYYYFDYPYYHWRGIITASTTAVVGSAKGLLSGLSFTDQLGVFWLVRGIQGLVPLVTAISTSEMLINNN